MINGLSIPVLTPFKFYPVDVTTGDGVNFQNIDNTELHDQTWEGVYPNRFYQPVARYWNDYTPGIDFQIITEGQQYYDDTTVTFQDLSGNVLFTLESENFFTKGTQIIGRFYADKFTGVADGCYVLVIRIQDNPVYQSEIITLSDEHEYTYPLEFSNFENDFGLIFTNAASVAWRGKILIPMRMFRPATAEEKEVYNNDVGELTTLRDIPKRIYIIESMPVSNWYAEKVKMMFGCSDLILNKTVVNTEAGIAIEPLSETDKMEIVGNVQLNDFTDEYVQEEQIDTVTELLTSWTADGATVGDWDTFDTAGNTINTAFYDAAGIATAYSNTISLTDEQWYLLVIDVTVTDGGQILDAEVTIDGQTFDIEDGKNVFLILSITTGTDNIVMTCKESSFSATTSFKKIS